MRNRSSDSQKRLFFPAQTCPRPSTAVLGQPRQIAGTIAGTSNVTPGRTRILPTLTETRIRAAKGAEKPYKLRDGGGLHLLVTPAGGRLWRMRYRHRGRESMIGLGSYPDVSLKVARARRDEARKLLGSGGDPAAVRRAERAGRAEHVRGHCARVARQAVVFGGDARESSVDVQRFAVPIPGIASDH